MSKPNSPTQPKPVQPVRVRRHRINWGASDLDLAEVTAQRAMSLGPQFARGCWYLNPRFTVSCPAPTAEFFAKVRELRSAWLRTCRQVLGNYGQRQLARQVEGQGRQGAILPVYSVAAVENTSDQPPEPISLSDLPAYCRREVVEAGQVAKQLAFSGLLFLDGELIPPQTWQAMAEALNRLPHTRSMSPGPSRQSEPQRKYGLKANSRRTWSRTD